MTTYVDYAWWQVTPAQLATMGFSGAARYGTPGNTKSITPPEVLNLRAAGFGIFIVFESTGSRATEGFNAGHDDAVACNTYMDKIGYPKTCTLAYAVDGDYSVPQVQPYFDGVASVGGRPEAPYGGYRVVDGVKYRAPYGWQTSAWSYSGKVLQISKRAGLLQNVFAGNYDSNKVLVPNFGQWQPHATPLPVHYDVEGEVMEVTQRPGGFGGHDCYDVIVDGLGKLIGKRSDGSEVHVLRSEVIVRRLDTEQEEFQVYAPWESPEPQTIGGSADSGSRIPCLKDGLVSIVDDQDTHKLHVEYVEYCG